MLVKNHLKIVRVLPALMGCILLPSSVSAASFSTTYCEMRMCEVRSHCIGHDCQATECHDGSFLLEISMTGSELSAFTVSRARDSRSPFGTYVVDPKLSDEDTFAAKGVSDREITLASVELSPSREPTGLVMTNQTRNWPIDVTVLSGGCEEKN